MTHSHAIAALLLRIDLLCYMRHTDREKAREEIRGLVRSVRVLRGA